MPVIIKSQDSFTDTDGILINSHTPDVGSSWTAYYGGTTIIGNTLKNTTAGARQVTNRTPFIYRDCYSQCKITTTGLGFANQLVSIYGVDYLYVNTYWRISLNNNPDTAVIFTSSNKYRIERKGRVANIYEWNGSAWDLIITGPSSSYGDGGPINNVIMNYFGNSDIIDDFESAEILRYPKFSLHTLANSSVYVDLTTDKAFKEAETLLLTSNRAAAGTYNEYKWGSYKAFDVPLKWVTHSSHSLISSWWNSRAKCVLRYYDEVTDTSSLTNVLIMNDKFPLSKIHKPHHDIYQGKLELEGY